MMEIELVETKDYEFNYLQSLDQIKEALQFNDNRAIQVVDNIITNAYNQGQISKSVPLQEKINKLEERLYLLKLEKGVIINARKDEKYSKRSDNYVGD